MPPSRTPCISGSRPTARGASRITVLSSSGVYAFRKTRAPVRWSTVSTGSLTAPCGMSVTRITGSGIAGSLERGRKGRWLLLFRGGALRQVRVVDFLIGVVDRADDRVGRLDLDAAVARDLLQPLVDFVRQTEILLLDLRQLGVIDLVGLGPLAPLLELLRLRVRLDLFLVLEVWLERLGEIGSVDLHGLRHIRLLGFRRRGDRVGVDIGFDGGRRKLHDLFGAVGADQRE